MKKFNRYDFLRTNRPLRMIVKSKVEFVREEDVDEVDVETPKMSKHKKRKLRKAKDA